MLALGGTATMDAGAGLLEIVDALPVPAPRRLRRERNAARAPRLFGPQKGADPARSRSWSAASAPGGAVLFSSTSPAPAQRVGWGRRSLSLGAELVSGASYVLDAIGFDGSRSTSSSPARDASTRRPARQRPLEVVAARPARCVVFGGIVEQGVPGAEVVALSGDRERARAISSRWAET